MRLMRQFLAIFVALLIPTMFFAYPPIIEASDGECTALAQRVEDLASHDDAGRLTVAPLYGASSSAPSGAALARDRYKLLPAGVGCTVAYWRTLFAPPAISPAPAADPQAQIAAAAAPLPLGERREGNIRSTIARDMTPNGDPISPETTFTLPMPSVAIRVDEPATPAGSLRFQLMQGRAVLATCVGRHAVPGGAWCRFAIDLRKGVYSIAVSAGNGLLGQFPFTVIGR